jgi:hypothetical protein
MCEFMGVSGFPEAFVVVKPWWDRGGLCGERGVLTSTFLASENTPHFSSLFLVTRLRGD